MKADLVSMTGILIVWLIYRSTSHWSFNRYFVFITRVLVMIFLWYDLHNVTFPRKITSCVSSINPRLFESPSEPMSS